MHLEVLEVLEVVVGVDVAEVNDAASGAEALVADLPAKCSGDAAPAAAASLSFVADGRVFALDPASPAAVHCLFETKDPGLFSWGPMGDRVVLEGDAGPRRGLERRPARRQGEGLVLQLEPARRHHRRVCRPEPEEAASGGHGCPATRDITPQTGVTYGDVAYHPSGLAIGYVTHSATETGFWMATNQGDNPVRLITAPPTTNFGHIVFTEDGEELLYSVDDDVSHSLARLTLRTGFVSQNVWTGIDPIADIVHGGQSGVGLTIGATCASRKAVYADDGEVDEVAVRGCTATRHRSCTASTTIASWLRRAAAAIPSRTCTS